MIKLKIFTNHYLPENFKINELSEELSKYYEISVITQTPNYSKGTFFNGYSWFKRRKEVINGIEIKRLPVIPRKEGNFGLFFNYITYIISAFFYSLFTRDKADHVFVYITSPVFIAWAGLRFAKRNNIKSTLYLLDLWPGSLISILNIQNKTLIRFLEVICINIYQRFDNIVVSSYRFIEVLTSYGIDENRIKYIPQHAENSFKRKNQVDSEKNVLKIVFTGNIGEAQGLNVLVDTAFQLKELGFYNVLFQIVGDGRYRNTLESNIKKEKLEEYFKFDGYVDSNKIPKILAQNHFGFVSLSDHDIFNRTLPAKVQSYMSHGIPILASANGEVPLLIDKANCGYYVNAGDSNKLAQLIINLNEINSSKLEEMSKNSYNYSNEHFNKEKIVEKFIEIMEEGAKNV